MTEREHTWGDVFKLIFCTVVRVVAMIVLAVLVIEGLGAVGRR